MKIGTSSLYNIYLYAFAVFIVFKVWRAFSGSTEQGGIWNYIQVLYVVCGIFLLLSNFKIIKKEKSIVCMILYSCWAFLVAFLTAPDFEIATMYGLLKTLFPATVFIVFYLYGNKVESFKKNNLIIKSSFYLAAIILIRMLSQYMTAGGLRASGVGAVADVYYILGLLPFVIAISGHKERFLAIIITGVCIFFSQKRTGTIILVGVIFLFYLLDNNKSIKEIRKNFAIIFATGIILCCLMIYMDQAFNLRIVSRLLLLESDGGSGRLDRWLDILAALEESSTTEFFYGHGYNSVATLFGGNAHNDFLQVLFEYGLLSLFFYIGYFFSSFYTGLTMKKDNYENFAEYFASVFISFGLACFSFYVIDATYIICGCFAQGIFIADWKKQRQLNS